MDVGEASREPRYASAGLTLEQMALARARQFDRAPGGRNDGPP
jgi:hypothetical protein